MINTEKPVSAIKYNGEALPMEAAIADGVVVKARNQYGYMTEVDFYGNEIYSNAFDIGGVGAVNTPFGYLNKVNLKTPITAIKHRAFACGKIENDFFAQIKTQLVYEDGVFMYCYRLTDLYIDAPIIWERTSKQLFRNCANLVTVNLPQFISSDSTSNEDGQFSSCTKLQTVTLGSLGHAVQSVGSQLFHNCTQTGLTITVFSTSDKMDSIAANIRNKATNATIIIKDCTTGETLITSTIEEDTA